MGNRDVVVPLDHGGYDGAEMVPGDVPVVHDGCSDVAVAVVVVVVHSGLGSCDNDEGDDDDDDDEEEEDGDAANDVHSDAAVAVVRDFDRKEEKDVDDVAKVVRDVLDAEAAEVDLGESGTSDVLPRQKKTRMMMVKRAWSPGAIRKSRID